MFRMLSASSILSKESTKIIASRVIGRERYFEAFSRDCMRQSSSVTGGISRRAVYGISD